MRYSPGRDYKKYLAMEEKDRVIEFGKDDVYVYDSRGRLFYARGVEKDGEMTYEAVTKNKPNNVAIQIVDKSQVLNPDKTKSTITVKIESTHDIETVMIGGRIATPVVGAEKTYEIEVSQNGTYEIVAKDVEGNTARDSIAVKGIGSNSIPTVTAIVKNAVRQEGDVWILNEKVAKLELTSATATRLYISNVIENQEDVVDWLAFAQNVERYFDDAGDKKLYIFVKDENGNYNEPVCEVKLRIEIDETRPTAPVIDIKDGQILFAESLPTEEWAKHTNSYGQFGKYKNVTITYPTQMQSDGYQSSYRIKTSLGGKWNNAEENEITIKVTKNATVEAKLGYSSVFASKNIAEGSYDVTHIDTTPPTIQELKIIERNGVKNIIQGTATETASNEAAGLPDKPYLIMMNAVDFNVVSVGNYTWTDDPTMEITETGKYYFYVRDGVGNVAMESIYAEAPDIIPPVIDSISQTPVDDDVILRIVAHDNVGIVKYAIVKDSDQPPTTWRDIAETKQLVTEETITQDGIYTIWAKDNVGLTGNKSVEVITNKYPVLDTRYPEDVHTLVDTTAEFRVVITQPGYPDIYLYKWFVSTDNGATWTEIAGATAPVYTTNKLTLEENGNLYKCTLTNERGTVESRVATLEVVKITNDEPTLEIVLEKEGVLGGVIINNGATTTTSNTVTVKIVGLNLSEVNVSESASGTNHWTRYSETVQYTLAGNGERTIYVRAKDHQGNILSTVVSAKITKQ